MTKRSSNVVALRPDTVTISMAARRFLSEKDLSASTRRVYGLTLDALIDDLGRDTPLSEVTSDAIAAHLATHYKNAAPTTYNRIVATLGSFFRWAIDRRLLSDAPLDGIDRRKERRTRKQAETRRPIEYADLDALWSRKDVALREKTFWHLLYDTAARANEVLGLNVEDLNPAQREARITGKGGHAEVLYYATGTARLLPRLIGDRTTGPLFLTDRRARVALAKGDLDPATGRARLSYRRAAELFTEASGGWTLHQLRHSALTRYAEQGESIGMLKAKSRHRSLRSLERYLNPSEASVAKMTARHDAARRR